MATFRNPFTRKDSPAEGAPGSGPRDGRLALAGFVTPAGDLGVTPGVISGLTVTGKTAWAYTVSAGHAVTTRGATDGASLPGLDGATDTPTVTAAPATGSRWDLIWIRQRDVDNADPDSEAVLGVTSGTSSGSPSKPYGSVPAGALVLAEAQIGAGAANTADPLVTITPVAPRVASRGGIIAATAAQRDALTGATPTNPQLVDVGGAIYRNAGSGWALVASIATGPTDITLLPGWQALVGFPLPSVYTRDGQVNVQPGIVGRTIASSIPVGGSFQVGSVPVGMRPAANTYGVAVVYAGGVNAPVIAHCYIDTAGLINVQTPVALNFSTSPNGQNGVRLVSMSWPQA